MKRYIAFLGSPSISDLRNGGDYQWKKVLIPDKTRSPTDSILPPATLDAVTSRISILYQNVIFSDEDVELQEDESSQDISLSKSASQDQVSEMIDWPPTDPQTISRVLDTSVTNEPSTSVSRFQTAYETQDPETQDTASYNISDGSSIALFPAFHIKLNALTSLSALTAIAKSGADSRKINFVAAVLEVEGPDTITIKKGPDAGKEVAILKLVLGDEAGGISKLTAWREIAAIWGGKSSAASVKRGDIIYVENVQANYTPKTTSTLTASSKLSSKLEICYRSLPFDREDLMLRPDLRLGESDPAVRKVAGVVRWFQSLAGIS